MSEIAALSIRRERLGSTAAARLIARLNAELTAIYPEPGANHFGLAAEDVNAGRGAFFVAYEDQQAVGCGAVRLIDAKTAELKRMYVEPARRGRGIGRALLEALEAEARQLGAGRIVLETGARQTAAVALYARCGYEKIPLFGEYLQSPETSLCLGKSIVT
jgi:GNAT superfamily N-acetyltransferase